MQRGSRDSRGVRDRVRDPRSVAAIALQTEREAAHLIDARGVVESNAYRNAHTLAGLARARRALPRSGAQMGAKVGRVGVLRVIAGALERRSALCAAPLVARRAHGCIGAAPLGRARGHAPKSSLA